MKIVKHLGDVKELLGAGRLMEAESLERHLLVVLSSSVLSEHRIVASLLSEPQETARNKMLAIVAAMWLLDDAPAEAGLQTQFAK